MSSPLPASAAATGPKRRRAAFVRLCLVLSILLIIGQLHRSAGSVLSPALTATFDVPASSLAGIIGALFLTQGLSQIPAGVLLDRYGPRLVIPLLACIAAIGSVIFATSETSLGLQLGRLLIGTGFSATVMGTYVLLTRWAPPERFSSLAGIMLCIGGVGGMMATSPLALALQRWGWSTTFLFIGIATLLGAALVCLTVRDNPADAVSPPVAPTSLVQTIRELRIVMRERQLWPVLAVSLVLYTPQQILLGIWAGPFLADIHGLDLVPSSHILLAMSFALNLGSLAFGPIDLRLNRRKQIVCGSAAAIASAFFVLAFLGASSLLLSVAAMCVTSLLGSFFILIGASAQSLFPREFTGRVMTLLNSVSVFGVFCVQNLTGALIAMAPSAKGTASLAGYQLVFGFMGMAFVVVALVFGAALPAAQTATRTRERHRSDAISGD